MIMPANTAKKYPCSPDVSFQANKKICHHHSWDSHNLHMEVSARGQQKEGEERTVVKNSNCVILYPSERGVSVQYVYAMRKKMTADWKRTLEVGIYACRELA